MAERYDSDPIPIMIDDEDVTRIDLIFHGVDHSGPSFEARVFLNNPEADQQTPKDAEAGYAGSFYIFGHGGCFGDIGHCEIPQERADPYDLRPPHQLTPQKRTVVVTEAVKPLLEKGETEVRVTVVPVVEPVEGLDITAQQDVLHFQELTLVTYEE